MLQDTKLPPSGQYGKRNLQALCTAPDEKTSFFRPCCGKSHDACMRAAKTCGPSPPSAPHSAAGERNRAPPILRMRRPLSVRKASRSPRTEATAAMPAPFPRPDKSGPLPVGKRHRCAPHALPARASPQACRNAPARAPGTCPPPLPNDFPLSPRDFPCSAGAFFPPRTSFSRGLPPPFSAPERPLAGKKTIPHRKSPWNSAIFFRNTRLFVCVFKE